MGGLPQAPGGSAALSAHLAASKPSWGVPKTQWVGVQRGLMMCVCVCVFSKGTNKEFLPQIVDTLLNMKLRETEKGKPISGLPGYALIIL